MVGVEVGVPEGRNRYGEEPVDRGDGLRALLDLGRGGCRRQPRECLVRPGVVAEVMAGSHDGATELRVVREPRAHGEDRHVGTVIAEDLERAVRQRRVARTVEGQCHGGDGRAALPHVVARRAQHSGNRLRLRRRARRCRRPGSGSRGRSGGCRAPCGRRRGRRRAIDLGTVRRAGGEAEADRGGQAAADQRSATDNRRLFRHQGIMAQRAEGRLGPRRTATAPRVTGSPSRCSTRC